MTYITIEEAAERICVSSRTLRRMISRGEVEARRFGPRLLRVNAESLEGSGRLIRG